MRGWRYFFCDDCDSLWKETCRDHETLSNSRCISDDCPSHLTGGVMPFASRPDENLATDGHGNLAADKMVPYERRSSSHVARTDSDRKEGE